MNEEADTILDVPMVEPQQPQLPSLLEALMERVSARDEETNELLGEIRVALDALLARLPAPGDALPAPTAPSQLDYSTIIERVRACVAEVVPVGSTIAVVNKGDMALLRHDRRAAQHYPQASDGSYAGFYPSDSTGAIAQLERARESGVEFFILPATSFWWLEHYEGLRRHLDTRYKVALRCDDACLIYDLREGMSAPAASGGKVSTQTFAARLCAYLAVLIPAKSHLAIISKGDPALLALPRHKPVHFPRQEDGNWIGYHPADSAACIEYLDAEIAAGARWLVVPHPQTWYLEHYAEFAAHLTARHRLVARQRKLGVVFELNPNSP